jgi:hypothetical protein
LLHSIGRLSEAAELHVEDGNLVQAISLFLEDGDNPSAMKRALECIVGRFWETLSVGIVLETISSDIEELVTFIPRLNPLRLTRDAYGTWLEVMSPISSPSILRFSP